MKTLSSFICVLLGISVAVCPGVAAELLTNGSFEANGGAGALPAGWTSQGSAGLSVGVSQAVVQGGTWSVRVSGRAVETDGLRYNVTSQLAAAGSGVRRWCRAYVRVDDFASVRVLLRLTDAGGSQPDLVLAERMVRTPGQWLAVEGGSAITWNGALQNASVRIEVLQHSRVTSAKPADLLPDYYVDSLTWDNDGDGDQILDRDEAAAGFNPALADSDGDGLPDRWELDHGFSPAINEAGADADGDGFTNRQEFYAATDPRSASSYPGKPANPNANASTRAVLRWLALLPSQTDGRHLAVGQQISDLGSTTEYAEQIDGLATLTGKYPAILSMAIEPPFDRFGIPLQIDVAESRALAYWQAGGIPLLKWAVYNPWTIKNGNDQTKVDILGLIDPAGSDSSVRAQNQAAHDTLLSWMTQVGDALERLQSQGVVVMFRHMSEMNGGWFWWGHREFLEYQALWIYFYDYFTQTRGLNNLIWVYESASQEHAPSFVGAGSTASDYYYPGDDRVDAMCHNLYSGDWVLPWDGNRIHAQYPKIYGIPQAGPDHANRTGFFDNLIYLNRSKAALPRSSFFIVWNSFNGTDPATGVSSEQRIAIVDNKNAGILMNHAEIVTRDTVAWAATVTPPSIPPSPTSPTQSPPSNPTTPAAPSSTPGNSGGGGGGGAASPWFLAALSVSALIRSWCRRD